MKTLTQQFNSLIPSLQLPQITRVTIDSRAVMPGDLFVALIGAQVDGHLFLQDAWSRGAKVALIRSDYSGIVPEGMIAIRVKDTLETMQALAKERVQLTNAKVIALTGSVGKTTTKEFIKTLASSYWKTFATTGNQNSQVGLSQTILNSLQGDEEVLVIEMGMTAPGHIEKLLQIAPPDIAMIVQIALVHAQFFEEGLEGIAKAKSEIFTHPNTKLGLINLDTNCVDTCKSMGSIPKKGFTSKGMQGASLSLEITDNELIFNEEGSVFRTEKPQFPVRHVYDNLLAAIMAVRSLQMPWDAIFKAIGNIQLPEKRLELIRKGSVDVINDSYNAAELSMKSALDFLSSFRKRRRVAILGQMRELGRFSKECHARVAEHALDKADLLLCLGEECAPMVEVWKKAGREVQWAMNFDELAEYIDKTVENEDILLLKGSRSNGLWRVLDLI